MPTSERPAGQGPPFPGLATPCPCGRAHSLGDCCLPLAQRLRAGPQNHAGSTPTSPFDEIRASCALLLWGLLARRLPGLPLRKGLSGAAREFWGVALSGQPEPTPDGKPTAPVDGPASTSPGLSAADIRRAFDGASDQGPGEKTAANTEANGSSPYPEVGYGDELLHGEAVAIGMVMAFDLSAQLGLCPAEDAARVRRHLAAVGLPTSLEALPGRIWDPDRLLDHMSRDKKVEAGRIGFVLARRIGEAFLERAVPPEAVRALLYQAAAA